MPTRPTKGNVVRQVGDWQMDQMMGGAHFSAALAGQYSILELYNNATDGSYLWVYGLTALLTALDGIYLETYTGTHAACFPGQGSLTFDQATGPGIVGSYTSTVDFGIHIGALYSNSQHTFWPYPAPVARIPPRYSFALRPGGLGESLNAAFWWLPLVGA
jgi:hypothetical protein